MTTSHAFTQADIAQFTPMMQQYHALKQQCSDCILFFRMGDFYEVFGQDAEEIAPKLDILITSRERGDSQRIKFCGVPHHSANAYWLKLVRLNYKVAIADQVESAAEAKGLVRREIIKILTPGCLDELEGIEANTPNFLLATFEDPKTKTWAVTLADPSTGDLRLGSVASFELVLSLIETFQPKELLVRRFCESLFVERMKVYRSQHKLLLSHLPEAILRDQAEQKHLLTSLLGTHGFVEAAKIPGGCEVLSGLFNYLASLHMSNRQFLKLNPLQDQETMLLSETTIRDLELFETVRSRKTEGSLFHQVNACLTPMGARKLRWSLTRPWITSTQISQQHDKIAELVVRGADFVETMREHLKQIPDLERLTTRLHNQSIRPRELAKLKQGLQQAQVLFLFLERSQTTQPLSSHHLWKDKEPLIELLLEFNRCLREDPGLLGEGDQIFCDGFDPLLDEKNSLWKHGSEKVEGYLSELKAKTQINSLKIKEHKTFGLLLEVTRSNLDKVPTHFVRKQTMVNCERFITEELIELSSALASAKELAIQRELELYAEWIQHLSTFANFFTLLAASLASLDVLQSHAWLALHRNYQRPKLRQDELRLKQARHPVVEFYVGPSQFEPNDLFMSKQRKQLLITGPNMAGKSTIMRQTAICAILCQAGGFVPASDAELPIFDNIFTRVGAADDLSQGLSTFMVEMKESAFILRHATAQSLVILDEVGRGTSTQDGIAIASAIFEDLIRNKQSWTLFATHYHELVPFAQTFPTVSPVTTEVLETSDGIRFTHRLCEGACGSSYGIEVAKLAGLPVNVVGQAQVYLQKNAALTASTDPSKSSNFTKEKAGETFKQQEIYRALQTKLESIRINRLTPVQALNILNDLIELNHKPLAMNLFEDQSLLF